MYIVYLLIIMRFEYHYIQTIQVNMYIIFIIIKGLRTTHEILSKMLAFAVEKITRIVARKTDSAEGFQK